MNGGKKREQNDHDSTHNEASCDVPFPDTIEVFIGNVKRTIEGTYVHVSPQWLQTYLWEFEFRHNLRKSPQLMLDLLLQSFPRPALSASPKEADRNVG